MTKCPACGYANIDGSDECDSCRAPLSAAPAARPGMEKRILEGSVLDLGLHAALTAAPSDTLAQAVETMREGKMGCVLVLEGGRLAGVLSERELLFRTDAETNLSRTRVGDVMRAEDSWLREDDPVADAFHRMAVSGNRHVPVRRADKSFAVISARDLLSYLCR